MKEEEAGKQVCSGGSSSCRQAPAVLIKCIYADLGLLHDVELFHVFCNSSPLHFFVINSQFGPTLSFFVIFCNSKPLHLFLFYFAIQIHSIFFTVQTHSIFVAIPTHSIFFLFLWFLPIRFLRRTGFI